MVLTLIALALSVYSAALIWMRCAGRGAKPAPALLESIGYVVIAVAVFDVAKYFMEEEVIRGREMRLASEARRSLTKFISTIAIAVFIEGLVMVFRQGGQDIALILYPAAILFTGILIILGLGLYQRLSADVERQVEAKDRAQDKQDNGQGRTPSRRNKAKLGAAPFSRTHKFRCVVHLIRRGPE